MLKRTQDQLAFGVVPAYRKYELYQARYYELMPVLAEARREHGEALEVLDVGPGMGEAKRFSDQLVGSARWTAVEVVPRFVENCRRLGYVDVIEGVDLERQPLPVPEGRYHVVVASHVLEHLENAPDAVRDWLRVLKPGGHLLIGVPMHFGWLAALARLRFRLFGRKPRAHCLFFSMRTLRAFLSGLPVVRIWGFRVFSARQWVPLEDAEWFFKLSRWIGVRAPWLTGEVIVHLRKP